MRYRFLAAARQEAVDLGDWFEAQRAGAGADFIAELEALIQRLLVHPRLYARVPRSPRGREVRLGRTYRYPVKVAYEVTATELIILSVTHARKKQQGWPGRLHDPPSPEPT